MLVLKRCKEQNINRKENYCIVTLEKKTTEEIEWDDIVMATQRKPKGRIMH